MIRKEINFSILVSQLENWDVLEFMDDILKEVVDIRTDYLKRGVLNGKG